MTAPLISLLWTGSSLLRRVCPRDDRSPWCPKSSAGQSSDPRLKTVKGFPLGWRQMSRSLSSWLAVTVGPATVSPSHPKVNRMLCHLLALKPSSPVQGCCFHLIRGTVRGSIPRPSVCCFRMTVQLTQSPLSRGFLFPFPPARRQASQLGVPEARSPGPPGRATGGIPAFASAPEPSTCSLGLTSSVLASPAPVGAPLT